MEIGFAKVNITPPILTCSNGGFYDDPKALHLGVHDELYARAIVFQEGNQMAAIVSADLINLPRHTVESIKEMIGKHTGLAGESIILHATHQHSGPFSYRKKEGIRNDAYWTVTEQKIVGVVYSALQDMQPCLIGAGSTDLDMSLNRRILQEDGTVLYLPHHPGLTPNQVVDQEVGVVSFRKLDKRPLVTLINYSCHPLTIGFVPRMISADFPGAVVREVENRLFGSAVYTGGACGNIHPKKHCEGFEAMDELGRAIADRAIEVLPFIQTGKGGEPRTLYREVDLELNPDKMDGNEDIAEYREGRTYRFGITVIALNEIAFVAIPCEYFVEFQLEIKKQSPFAHTYLLTTSNGYAGYVPDRKAYDQGGYEVNSTKFMPGSGEMIQENILQALRELAGDRAGAKE
ncbi:MAG: neutral/alkaline non-lysosomal ceramidase N-terminal domain-containing protein [Fidelibacterota bacterium]|nr:MAG: neutral/alkaline non-lysosomal ceramidase N-terminal domain-containing protein [Candidatus Neomarinimicrobiota bacterium]